MPTRQSLDALTDSPHATVFPGETPRTIWLTLAADESVDPHSHPGHDVVIYVVSGRVDFAVDDEIVEAEDGDVVHVDGDRSISPRARQQSTALVVLARRPD